MTDTATADTKPKVHPIIVLRGYLEERADTFRNALPPHIKPERFIASVLTAVQINPDLLAADRRSLFIACMRCAQDGLLPDGTEAAIVPFKKEAQYMPMYQGLIKKFRNSGQFKWIGAEIVYEGDEFERWIDESGPHFKHVPVAAASATRKMRLVYAAATTRDGGFFIQVMSEADIAKRRAMSRASREDAPWNKWEDEMKKKTALRVLSKLLPKSSDIDAFLREDEEASLGVDTSAQIADQRGEAFGSLMDHFAESGSASTSDAGSQTGADAQAGSASQDTGPKVDVGAPPSGSGPATAPTDDALATAYRRGQEARASGVARKAMPGEYRDDARQREQIAWTAGHDGSPMPSFKAES